MINFSLISNKISNSKENMVIVLVLSLTCLIKSVDIFVKNAGEVTRILKLPLTIGILLFAFGNTMPDAVLSITSAVEGESTVAIYDLLEVLMINCSLIVGIIILGSGSILKDEQNKKKIKLYNSLIFVIWEMIILVYFIGQNYIIQRIIGCVMIIITILHYMKVCTSKVEKKEEKEEKICTMRRNTSVKKEVVKKVLIIIGTILIMLLSSKSVLYSVSLVMLKCKMNNNILKGCFIGIFSNLTEIVTCLRLARKENNKVAILNLYEGNIICLGLIIGLVMIISPFKITNDFLSSMLILTFVSMLPLFKEKMGRKEGILLVAMYFLNIGMKTFWNF